MAVPILNANGEPMLRNLENNPYRAANRFSQELTGYFPTLGSADSEILRDRDLISSRAMDQVRNNGWAKGGIEKKADAVVGSRIRVSAKPAWRALGLDEDWAEEWADSAEAIFDLWGYESGFYSDLERAQNFGMNVRTAYMHWCTFNEALAVIRYKARPGAFLGTTVHWVDTNRINDPWDRNDLKQRGLLREGVELDLNGAWTAVHVSQNWSNDTYRDQTKNPIETIRVPRERKNGRPIAVFAFSKERLGAHRGISRLVTAVSRLHKLEKYDDAEVNAAILDAFISAYIKSDKDTDLAREVIAPTSTSAQDFNGTYAAARLAYHEDNPVLINGMGVTHLFPGEDLGIKRQARSGSNFEAFQKQLLRSIASTLNMPYESLAHTWGEANYSSARAALVEWWRSVTSERQGFCQMLLTPIFDAVVEEAVLRGILKIPFDLETYYRTRKALSMCEWRGPGRGWIDPVKEAQGARMLMAAGLSTLEQQAAEQGLAWNEIADQKKREHNGYEARGLTHPDLIEEEKAKPH